MFKTSWLSGKSWKLNWYTLLLFSRLGFAVGEAVVAFEIARALCEKFGGDSLAEMRRNHAAYLAYLKAV